MVILPRYNNCVLDHRYFTGSFRDWSGNDNHGVPTGCHWENKFVRFVGSNDLITVSDSSELQLTNGTIIVYGNFDQYTSQDRLVSKRDAGGTNYDLLFNSTTALGFYDGAAVRTATINWSGSKSVAISFAASGTPKAYKDGVFVTNFNGSSTVTVDDADVIVGNYFGGASTQSNPMKGVLIYNVVLTADEIADIHKWITERQSITKTKKNFGFSSRLKRYEHEINLIAAWEMKSSQGIVVDLIGVLDGTISGTVAPSRTDSGLNSLRFDGIGQIGISGDNTFTTRSYSFLAKSSLTTINCVFSHGASAIGAFYFNFDSGRPLLYLGSNNYKYWVDVPAQDNGIWHHWVVVIAGSGTQDISNAQLYCDGILQTVDFVTFPASAGNPWGNLLIASDNTNYFEGDLAEFEIYDKILLQQEVSALYRKYARLIKFYDDLTDANESVTSISSGVALENTQWRIDSGSFKIARDESLSQNQNKVIECSTAGILWQPSGMAYGTWEFDWYKGLDANTIRVLLVASVIGDISASNQNAYQLQYNSAEALNLQRRDNGSFGSDVMTSASSYLATDSVWYRMRLTRRYDGSYTMFVKGGSFIDWVLVDTTGGGGTNPAIDNVHNDSKYIVLELDPGDKISNFRFYNGVID
jgi:hypothetical protein